MYMDMQELRNTLDKHKLKAVNFALSNPDFLLTYYAWDSVFSPI